MGNLAKVAKLANMAKSGKTGQNWPIWLKVSKLLNSVPVIDHFWLNLPIYAPMYMHPCGYMHHVYAPTWCTAPCTPGTHPPGTPAHRTHTAVSTPFYTFRRCLAHVAHGCQPSLSHISASGTQNGPATSPYWPVLAGENRRLGRPKSCGTSKTKGTRRKWPFWCLFVLKLVCSGPSTAGPGTLD